jgi:hypothetical protein
MALSLPGGGAPGSLSLEGEGRGEGEKLVANITTIYNTRTGTTQVDCYSMLMPFGQGAIGLRGCLKIQSVRF